MNYDPQEMMKLTQDGYDRMADDWSSTRQSFWPELKEKIDEFILKDNYDDRIRLLDIGCGNGRLISTINSERVDYLGVDISKELLMIAKSKYPKYEFALIDTELEGLKYLDDIENTNVHANFDRVISIAVLHHIPPESLETWLTNIYDAVETDAHLLFTTWNLDKTYYELDENQDAVIDFMHHKESRYVHNYTYEEIKNYFEKVGFEIVDIYDLERNTGSGMSNTVILAKKPYNSSDSR